MSLDAPGIHALCARFHIRAKVLGLKAKGSTSSLDAARLNGMASALQWAAQELSHAASRTTTAADAGNGRDEPGRPKAASTPTDDPGSREVQP